MNTSCFTSTDHNTRLPKTCLVHYYVLLKRTNSYQWVPQPNFVCYIVQCMHINEHFEYWYLECVAQFGANWQGCPKSFWTAWFLWESCPRLMAVSPVMTNAGGQPATATPYMLCGLISSIWTRHITLTGNMWEIIDRLSGPLLNNS